MTTVLQRLARAFRKYPSKQTRRRVSRANICIAEERLERRELLTVSFETLADFGNADVQSSNPEGFVFGETLTYFTAGTIATGREIWRSDGTASGTFLLRDTVPGPESAVSSTSTMLTTVGDVAFFRVLNPLDGISRLWRSDGTSAGTQLVVMGNGTEVTNPDNITADEDYITFTATDVSGRRLFRLSPSLGAVPVPVDVGDNFALPFSNTVGVSTTEATYFAAANRVAPGGIGLIRLTSGSNASETLGLFRNLFPYKAIGNRLVFLATPQSAPIQASSEWWITDGTIAGTNPLNLPEDILPETMVLADDGSIMFMALAQNLEWQVWKTDGSEFGAVLQFSAGVQEDGSSRSRESVAGEGRIFFKGHSGPGTTQIWQTDGTEAGTFSLAAPSGVSIGDVFGSLNGGVIFEGYTLQNPGGFFYADSIRPEPVRLVQGTSNSLLSISVGIGPTKVFGNFNGELGIADPSSPFTMVKDLASGSQSSFPVHFLETSHSVVFATSQGLAKTNGTSAGTSLLNLNISDFVALPNGRIFGTDRPALQGLLGDLWTLAPGATRWQNFREIAPLEGAVNFTFLTTVGNQLYYLAGLNERSRSLWVTDGTSSGTRAVLDGLQHINDVTVATSFRDEKLLFERGPAGQNRALWITDGTASGTSKLLDFGPPYFFDNITTTFQAIGDQVLVFDPSGISAVTDGTVPGSETLLGLSAAFSNGSVKWFGEADGYLYAGKFTGSGRLELWRTDGTNAGSQLVRVIAENAGSPIDPSRVFHEGVTASGLVYFATRTTEGKADLWVSDGSSSGTRIIKDNLLRRNNSDGSNDLKLYSEFGKLFFLATDSSLGRRLWMSDGTEPGTKLLTTASGEAPPFMHVLKYLAASFGSGLVGFRGALYYGGITDEFGMEPVKVISDTIEEAPEPFVKNTGTALSLQWTELFGAESYDIQMVRLSTGEKTTVNVVGDRWVLPPLATDGIYRIWIRGIRLDGTIGPWNPEPFDFTPGNRPVIYSSPLLTEDLTPTFFWASPAGTTSSEVWINDLDSKQRVGYSIQAGHRSHYDSPQLSPSRYAAWVRTSGTYGTSPWSQVAAFTVLRAAPQNLTVEVDAQRRMTIRWSPVEGATDYEIFVRGARSSLPILNRFGVGPVTTFQLTTPVPGDLYSISVRARRPGRPSSAWTPVVSTFVEEAPKAVINSASIRWTAIGQAIGYQLRVINSRTGSELVNTTLTSLTYRHSLPPGKYELQMRTLYSEGNASVWANTPFELFHPSVRILPITQPTVDATPIISWNSQAGAINYEIYVQRVGQSAGTYRASNLSSTSHRIATPLAPGSYLVWVRALHPDGTRSDWGSGQSLRIGPPPVVSLSNRVIAWSPVTGATNYDIIVQVATGATGTFVDYLRANDLAATTVSMSDAPAGRYRAWVRAKRYEAGEVYLSEWSALLTFELV